MIKKIVKKKLKKTFFKKIVLKKLNLRKKIKKKIKKKIVRRDSKFINLYIFHKNLKFFMKKGAFFKMDTLFAKINRDFYLYNKTHFLRNFFFIVKKLNLPFRLMGIKKRGKSLGVPVSLSLIKQQNSSLHYFSSFKNQFAISTRLNFYKNFLLLQKNSFGNLNFLRNDYYKTAAVNKKYVRFRW